MKKYIFLGIGILLAFVMLLTNPTKQEHSDAIKALLNKSLTENLSEQSSKSDKGMKGFGAGLGMLLGKTMIDKMVDSYVGRENFLLFSLTKINMENEEKVIGFGAFGNVHIFNDVKEKMSELFKDKEN